MSGLRLTGDDMAETPPAHGAVWSLHSPVLTGKDAAVSVDLTKARRFDPGAWEPGRRVSGAEAVQVARRHFPDLLPDLQPILVPSPAPPPLPEGEEARVAFLVEAYVTFSELHAPPGRELRDLVQRAKGAQNGARPALGARRALVEAARAMAGESWGELGAAVGAGKLPSAIAPHAWLLWAAGIDQQRRKVPGWPPIERLFAPRMLLSGKALRVFSHSGADLRASVRAGETWARSAGVGEAYAELMKRRQLVYERGFRERRDIEVLLYDAAGCHPDGCRDLRAAHEEEREKAGHVAEMLAEMAARGTWVWGRWMALGQGDT